MKLTSVDRKLLYELDFHARDTLATLAKRVGTSKQRLLYRFTRLQREGVIKGFYADVNPSKLGLVIYLIYFKFQHISAEKEKELIAFLNKQARISVNASMQGKWDHSVGIFAKDVQEFKRIYEQTLGKYDQFIKEKIITVITDFWYYKPKYLVDSNSLFEESMSGPLEAAILDETDNELLKLLADDARVSLLELGKKLKLTPNAVKARIRSLEKQKIILGYRVMIDAEKLQKLHYRVFFFLENDPLRQEAFRKFIAHQPEIISVTKSIGYCEMECRLLVDDVRAFYEVLGRIKAAYSDVLKDFEPGLYYQFHKSLNYYPLE